MGLACDGCSGWEVESSLNSKQVEALTVFRCYCCSILVFLKFCRCVFSIVSSTERFIMLE